MTLDLSNKMNSIRNSWRHQIKVSGWKVTSGGDGVRGAVGSLKYDSSFFKLTVVGINKGADRLHKLHAYVRFLGESQYLENFYYNTVFLYFSTLCKLQYPNRQLSLLLTPSFFFLVTNSISFLRRHL